MAQGCTLLNVPDEPDYDPYNKPINQSAMIDDKAKLKIEAKAIVAPTVETLADYDNDNASRKAEPKPAIPSQTIYWQ